MNFRLTLHVQGGLLLFLAWDRLHNALDRMTWLHHAGPEAGYGLLTDLTGELLSPQLAVRDVHQEHGIVPLPDPALFDRFPSGSKLRVLPNHACMTGAAYDGYNVHETDKVTARWDRVNGW